MAGVQQFQNVNLLDKEGELIAEVLSHYRELVMLATERVPANAALDAAAVNSMAMEVETRALISSIESLLLLSRHLKTLWLFGPLRRPGEEEATLGSAMARDARAVAELLGRFEAEHLRPLVERAQVEGGRGGPKGRSRNVNGTAMEGVTAEDGAAGPSSPPQAGSDSGGDRDEAGKSLGDDGGPDGGLPDAIQRVRAPGGDAGTGRMISLEAEQPADWVYRYVTSDGEGGAPSSSMAEASSDGRTEGVTAASQQHQHNSTSAGGEGGVDLEMTDHGHHAGTGAGQGGVEVIELE